MSYNYALENAPAHQGLVGQLDKTPLLQVMSPSDPGGSSSYDQQVNQAALEDKSSDISPLKSEQEYKKQKTTEYYIWRPTSPTEEIPLWQPTIFQVFHQVSH